MAWTCILCCCYCALGPISFSTKGFVPRSLSFLLQCRVSFRIFFSFFQLLLLGRYFEGDDVQKAFSDTIYQRNKDIIAYSLRPLSGEFGQGCILFFFLHHFINFVARLRDEQESRALRHSRLRDQYNLSCVTRARLCRGSGANYFVA